MEVQGICVGPCGLGHPQTGHAGCSGPGSEARLEGSRDSDGEEARPLGQVVCALCTGMLLTLPALGGLGTRYEASLSVQASPSPCLSLSTSSEKFRVLGPQSALAWGAPGAGSGHSPSSSQALGADLFSGDSRPSLLSSITLSFLVTTSSTFISDSDYW